MQPITALCPLCEEGFKYEYILKVEDLNSEMPAFIDYMGWDVDWSKSTKVRAIKKEQVQPTLSRQEITSAYFDVISMEDRLKVYEIYKYDFLLFGYTPVPIILA